MFPGLVTFYPMSLLSQNRGDPAFAQPTNGVTVPAKVQPWSEIGIRSESHLVAEASKHYGVFTFVQPNTAVDYLVTWNQRQFRVIGRSITEDGWNLWLTECLEVT